MDGRADARRVGGHAEPQGIFGAVRLDLGGGETGPASGTGGFAQPRSSTSLASGCSINAASRTRRVIGPTWSSDSDIGITPRVLTRP